MKPLSPLKHRLPAPQSSIAPIRNLKSKRSAAMALVVTLALLVLVTIAAMAFFARATANRTIEASRANQVLAAQLARSAQDYVAGQFFQEMTNNAQSFTSNGVTVYQVTNAVGMMPQKLLASGISSADATNAFANLVRQSVPGADPNASADNTATAAQNGRAVGADRWNAPILNFGAGFAATNQLPNWIYVNRDGSVTNAATTNAIGRFAYNVYETGGLLDANVAGHPASVSGTDLQAIKSTLAGADLTALGLSQTAIDALVNFRNPQSGASASAYTNYIAGAAREGFLKTVVTNGSGTGTTTNNFFTSRQDLLRYAQTQNTGLTNALPYLTHASRSSTAPSWGPTTPTGSSIDYAAQANSTSSANRFLPNVRVKNSFTRADGTVAKVDEPLIKSRFALSRLGGLGWNGVNTSGNSTLTNGSPSPASDATILRDFGLRWDNNQWEYVGHSGTTIQDKIKTLDEVASENREPNFFELLKAGILTGSLSGGTAINSMGAHLNPSYSRNSGDTINNRPLEDYHILQIGANIIDQYDADSFATEISIGGTPQLSFYGFEDLPYISRAYFTYFRLPTNYLTVNPITGPTYQQPSYRPWIRGWLRFDLWNPHRETSTSPNGNIRLVIEPNGNSLRLQATGTTAVTTPRGSGNPFNWPSNPQLTTPQSISSSINKNDFRINTKFDGSPSVTQGSYAESSHAGGFTVPSFTGFWLGDLYLPHIRAASTPPAATDNPLGTILGIGADASASRINLEFSTYTPNQTAPPNVGNNPELRLEMQTPNGWRVYQRILNFTPRVPNTIRGGWFNTLADLDLNAGGATPPLSDRAMQVGGFAWSFFDPRSQRFGFPSLEVGFDTRSNNADVTTVPMNVQGNPTLLTWNPNLVWGGGIPSDDLSNSTAARLFDPSYNFHAAPTSKESTHVNPEALGFLRYKSIAANNFNFGSFAADADGSAPHQVFSNISYRDADHVQRRGDNSPLATNDFYTDPTARPIVLNRPFRSIGELGVVSRDTPWRSLDVSSSRSSDAALAEILSISEEAGTFAGKVNLNTAPTNVLSSITLNTTEDAEANPSILNHAKSNALRDAIVTQRSASPFASMAEALSSVGSTVENPASGLVQASGVGVFSGPNVLIKTRRDAIARAFADTSHVNTWILFADIITQAGRFVNNAFQVESEERVWKTFSLHRNSAQIIYMHDEKASN